MSIDEELAELPEGWVFVKLEDITDFKNGINFQKDQKGENGILTIDVLNMYSQGIDVNLDKLYRVNIEVNQERILKYGDILFVRSSVKREGVGWASLFKEIEEPVTFCGFIIRARILSQDINPKYLIYFLRTNSAREEIVKSSNQVTITNINQESLGKIQIPICPSIEQRRLVTKIESLKARTARVKDSLSTIPALLDQFRQSVLAAAFRGALTADWREQNPDVEPASVLLEQIRNKQKAKLQNKGRLSKFKTAKFTSSEINNLPEIPGTWDWIYFGELITSIRSGSTAVPQNEVSNYPILRSSSVRPSSVDLEDIRFLTEEKSLNEDNFLCEGDLLFTRLSGSIDYVGNCAVVRKLNNQRIQYPDRLFCAKLIDKVYSIYSELCFSSPLLRNLIKQKAKSSAGHQRISMGDITEAIIPFPPPIEQQEIVRRVTSLFKFANQIEQQYQQSFGAINQLDQSILAQAFRGALVPQDPNDEPASVLLERIRTEREKSTGATPKRSKKSTDTSPSQTEKSTGATKTLTNKSTPFKEAIQMELELE